MGTVGLSFGSATSGAGFDVASTVTSILAISQAIETPWKTQLASLTAQDAVFTSLGTDLSTLSASLAALTDFQGVTEAKNGSSSNTQVVALSSAGPTASAGSHTITVSALAQTSSVFSSAVADATDLLSGTMSIKVGTGAAKAIPVGTTNTLASLAAAINLAGIGVQASVVSDTTGSRLSLVSETGGTAGQLTVTGSLMDATTATAVTTQQGLAGLDANLKVDGIDFTSGTNTISTAIPGVTFQILSESSNPVQVQITNDTSAVSNAMSNFVTAYNTVVKDLKTQEGKDASGKPEPLYGSPTLSLLQSQLSQGLLSGGASGAISNVMQLGLSVNDDGTLSFSDSDMTTALNSHFSDVVGFLQNTGSFGKMFAATLDGLGSESTTGAIYLAKQQNTAQEATLNEDITNEEALLAAQKISLTAELNEANQIMQSIPEQLSEVDKMYSAITGYNTAH